MFKKNDNRKRHTLSPTQTGYGEDGTKTEETRVTLRQGGGEKGPDSQSQDVNITPGGVPVLDTREGGVASIIGGREGMNLRRGKKKKRGGEESCNRSQRKKKNFSGKEKLGSALGKGGKKKHDWSIG